MRPHTATTLAARARGSIQPSTYGRTVAYRRLSTAPLASRSSATQSFDASPLQFLRSNFLPQDVLFRAAAAHARQFSSQSALYQQAQKQKPVKEQTAESEAEPKKTAEEQFNEEQAKEKKEGEEESGEQKEGEQEKKKKDDDKPPPPPHGDKTPWQVFTETLQQEFQASKDWNEGTKQLSGTVHDFTNDPRVQKAREASEAAKTKTAAALKATASAVGQGAAWTWDTMPVKGVRAAARVTGTGLDYATRPVRQTKAFQAVKETIDDGSSSRYGGWVEKEERRKRRELRELNELQRTGGRPTGPMEEDPDAGTNVTLHKDAKYKEVWRDWKDNSKIAQGFFSMKQTYGESDNAIISTARSITDRITGFFAENETAMVIKKFREMDPNFQMEPFLTEMREYILPEVLDAYVKGDIEVLKQWLSAAQYSVYAALMQQYKTAGLKSDGKIVDIRGVDVLNAKLLEPGEIPVFILTARTQEVHVYRNAKSGELASGMDDKVQQVTYAIGVTRIPEDVNNPETRGWRLIELQKSARDYY
ncbi:TIM44 subunit of mitochondria import inner membrane translocase [Macroventuria anomochaeta]|uniref:TIM44 subunit of mitochondria import inner membrane translocase n=1 Tax=Macroventuria anomochaeta TaxID=301207 RepID=A0ACB6SFW8_9PLEO|nr:TIM44 subunit of mitochondria import inner membrane translocase [Macroventuria anomochaeta]KAF2632204.1 TIM44 subunit of mitochondria import inner membrane translocase [Macroventuria anomochaeta]